jgi:hypothetical protein
MLRPMIRPTALVALLACGCPAQVEHLPGKQAAKAPPVVDESDPRVVRDGNDLYAAGAAPPKPSPAPVEASTSPGTGRPDESNGECRLYAPELPNPHCCNVEYGFDVDAVQAACGHDLYLGESFHYTCGYYFHAESGLPVWFRTALVAGHDVSAAAGAHDRKLREVTKNPAFRSAPVPGIPGALWSEHDGLHWAFLPGWPKVREVSWRDDSCSEEGVLKVLAQMAEAVPPEKGAKRLGMLPKARLREPAREG